MSKARYHLRARAEAGGTSSGQNVRCPGACAGWMDRRSPKEDTMESKYDSPGDKGPCGYRWGKMMGRRWCTSTK